MPPPVGPSLRRTLIRCAGSDPFDQAALLRLYSRDVGNDSPGPVLQADVRSQIARAYAVDGVTTSDAERVPDAP